MNALVPTRVEAKSVVLVLLVVVAFTAVKFWSVELPERRRLARLNEFANKLVKVPLVAKNEVAVALVVVESSPVKFCKVLDPAVRKLETVSDPKLLFPAVSVVAKRFVEDAVVAKLLVVVAAEPVALMKVKF
jgi:hypothetical protein